MHRKASPRLHALDKEAWCLQKRKHPESIDHVDESDSDNASDSWSDEGSQRSYNESDVDCSDSDDTNQSVSSTSVDSESEIEGEDWVRER